MAKEESFLGIPFETVICPKCSTKTNQMGIKGQTTVCPRCQNTKDHPELKGDNDD